MKRLLALAVALNLTGGMEAMSRGDADFRSWPIQQTPRGIVSTHFDMFEKVTAPDGKSADANLGPEHMLAQSLAGLTAMAVNEGRFDEMVWIGLDNASYDLWRRKVTARLGLEERGTFSPWQLVERYREKGIFDGYILYSYDYSEGPPTEATAQMDESVNVATSLSGVLKGLLVSDGMRERAEAMGLRMLADVRGRDDAWCFENHRDRLSRQFAMAQGPKMPNCRAIAITHRMLVFFGVNEPTPSIYDWLEPPASILGWNGGDEGDFVAQLSDYGHILLPCNWSLNLTVLSAGSHEMQALPHLKTVLRDAVGSGESDDAVAFIMSDGDNVQWYMGDFFTNPNYWASPDHGAFPIGWGAPYMSLMQACPDAYLRLAETQPDNSTINLHAGGYYYPDLLGRRLGAEKRREVLIRHARRLNHYMSRAGGTTLMFLCMDVDCAEARESYEILAREVEHLTGMFAIQYTPYEAGNGKVYWPEDAKGRRIPVVTAKYAIWADLNHERAGTPAKVARLIRDDAGSGGEALLAWTTVHTWSGFRKIEGDDEEAENGRFGAPGTSAAVTPTRWCAERLGPAVSVVTPEELLWRLRQVGKGEGGD